MMDATTLAQQVDLTPNEDGGVMKVCYRPIHLRIDHINNKYCRNPSLLLQIIPKQANRDIYI